jgi:hypothetical protein
VRVAQTSYSTPFGPASVSSETKVTAELGSATTQNAKNLYTNSEKSFAYVPFVLWKKMWKAG